jgi:dGTPase
MLEKGAATMTIREQSEELEQKFLSPRAALSKNAVRDFPISPCDVRTQYQRDRDRILHCKSFRRLKHKTQVFLSPEGDHYRTRMTHTLEVSQIARTVARALRLNEDLTEAIAMGHDLGHTPFGHAGEFALNECCSLGYTHAKQSVRVVERLENDGRGLNLTREVRDGIACHTAGTPAGTLEGRIVRFCDKIAYMNHDVDDAIRAGILREEDVPASIRESIGHDKSERITTFVNSLIENSGDDICMAPDVMVQFNELRAFLFEAVYRNQIAKGEEGKAKTLVMQLYEYFMKNPDRMPPEYRLIAEQEGLPRAVCDYISGMTDRYAVHIYENIFIPRSWGI